jgi:hypothetical protein
MPAPNQSPFDKDKKKKIKNELEDLLSQYGNGQDLEQEVVNQQLQEIVQAPPLDFEEMHKSFMKRATDITNSVFDFYVSIGILDNHEYLKQKKAMDEHNISNIFFQVKTIKFSIEKIMQEINAGSTHPRLFEVMGQLQDKLANAIKTQANYILFLEDSYKKMKSDVEVRNNQLGVPNAAPGLPAPSNDQVYVAAGTKNIMKTLRGEPTVAEFEVTEEVKLTDPKKKNELLEEVGMGHLVVLEDDEEDDFAGDIDEII